MLKKYTKDIYHLKGCCVTARVQSNSLRTPQHILQDAEMVVQTVGAKAMCSATGETAWK